MSSKSDFQGWEEEGLNRSTAYFFLAAGTSTAIYSGVCAAYGLGWRSAAGLDYVSLAALGGWSVLTKNRLIAKLMLFGIVVGLAELATDHWAVVLEGTLVYPLDEPMIWSSPLYMPVAWMLVMVQLGFVSLLFIRWKGMGFAMVSVAILGGLYIPFYEQIAKDADWWFYKDVPMVLDAPYFVLLSEAFICLAIPPIAAQIIKRTAAWGIVRHGRRRVDPGHGSRSLRCDELSRTWSGG